MKAGIGGAGMRAGIGVRGMRAGIKGWEKPAGAEVTSLRASGNRPYGAGQSPG